MAAFHFPCLTPASRVRPRTTGTTTCLCGQQEPDTNVQEAHHHHHRIVAACLLLAASLYSMRTRGQKIASLGPHQRHLLVDGRGFGLASAARARVCVGSWLACARSTLERRAAAGVSVSGRVKAASRDGLRLREFSCGFGKGAVVLCCFERKFNERSVCVSRLKQQQRRGMGSGTSADDDGLQPLPASPSCCVVSRQRRVAALPRPLLSAAWTTAAHWASHGAGKQLRAAT